MLPACVSMMQEYYRSAFGGKKFFSDIWNEFKFFSLPAMEPETLRCTGAALLLSEVERGRRSIEREGNRLSGKMASELELFHDLLSASAVYYWCGAYYVLLITDSVLTGFYGRQMVVNSVRAGSLLLKAMHEFEKREEVYLLVLRDAFKKEEYIGLSALRN